MAKETVISNRAFNIPTFVPGRTNKEYNRNLAKQYVEKCFALGCPVVYLHPAVKEYMAEINEERNKIIAMLEKKNIVKKSEPGD